MNEVSALTEVVHQLILGHTDTGILNSQRVVGLVRNDLDVEIRLGLDLLRVRDGLVPQGKSQKFCDIFTTIFNILSWSCCVKVVLCAGELMCSVEEPYDTSIRDLLT